MFSEGNFHYVTCECNHLTNFAMLLNVYDEEHSKDDTSDAMNIASLIGCSISIASLIATLVFHAGLRLVTLYLYFEAKRFCEWRHLLLRICPQISDFSDNVSTHAALFLLNASEKYKWDTRHLFQFSYSSCCKTKLIQDLESMNLID